MPKDKCCCCCKNKKAVYGHTRAGLSARIDEVLSNYDGPDQVTLYDDMTWSQIKAIMNGSDELLDFLTQLKQLLLEKK